MRLINNKGDTIIEVLISVAVLSVIIVGAYVTANRSYIILRDTNERVNALTLAQNQIESLVAWYNTNYSKPNSFTRTIPSNYFCLWNDLTIKESSYSATQSIGTLNSLPDCYVSSNNLPAGPSPMLGSLSQPPFYYSIADKAINSPLKSINNGACQINTTTFTVYVTWQSLLSGENRITLLYRPLVTPKC